MKIGIFTRENCIGEGGASSFNNTLLKDINVIRAKYDVLIIHQGRSREKVYRKLDGIEYINIRAYTRKRKIYQIFRSVKERIRVAYNTLLDLEDIYMPYSALDDLAEKYGVDIYWFTFPLQVNLSIPYIYTLWDLGHREYPFFPEVSRPMKNWMLRERTYSESLIRATYVITGNETGKKEIVSNYLIPEKKIRIVPFEVSSFCRRTEKKPDFDLPGEYYFYPAQFWAHKNHICILQAMKILKEEYGENINVVFSGSDKGNLSYIESRIKEYGLENQVMYAGFLKDEEIKYLYLNAKALIYASLMGPNNLPPIEAKFLGCPVIISDLCGHREQLGETAEYFDGYDPESLARILHRITSDESYYEKLKTCTLNIHDQIDSYRYIDSMMDIFDEFNLIMERWK